MSRRAIVTTAASALIGAGLLVTAPAAAAEPNPPGCEKGYFCLYSSYDQTGGLVLKRAGNWTGSVRAGSIFNNGVPYPNADHIQVYWSFGDYSNTTCLHYNPGPGAYKRDFLPGTVVTKVVWRGEC
ncbi:peptidase inhibitor family I36 protein [Actinomadura sp. 7K534]|uniref:peptidase inhibitor family I36 protein n=1 Tax=Actinomadura sp. 7K534 TaxID=2530366 RepID=UPI00104D793E|nr:peptidase inhibitor family I36 protein [Actinomadura sp. 7K534]TDB92115.1 hypothetical protein E1266_25380 [Actinomadura sp. 7K534]